MFQTYLAGSTIKHFNFPNNVLIQKNKIVASFFGLSRLQDAWINCCSLRKIHLPFGDFTELDTTCGTSLVVFAFKIVVSSFTVRRKTNERKSLRFSSSSNTSSLYLLPCTSSLKKFLEYRLAIWLSIPCKLFTKLTIAPFMFSNARFAIMPQTFEQSAPCES